MRPVITVTLNPALDLSSSTASIHPGPKLRCAALRIDPGGGGINVARVVAILEGHCRAVVAVGGTTGQELLDQLETLKLQTQQIEINGATRQSFAVTDETTGEQYRFVMPGPTWDTVTIERALSRIIEATPDNAIVVLSGSLPPGVPADFPTRLVSALPNRPVLMDLSGSALLRLASAPEPMPELLRMDYREGRTLSGKPLETIEETAGFAKLLVEKGAAASVIIARGADGSVLVTEKGAWHASAAKVEVDSKIGAGDSFVGAYAFALADGASPQEALRMGTAAASAAVTTPATELCSRDKVMELLPLCHITEVEI